MHAGNFFYFIFETQHAPNPLATLNQFTTPFTLVPGGMGGGGMGGGTGGGGGTGSSFPSATSTTSAASASAIPSFALSPEWIKNEQQSLFFWALYHVLNGRDKFSKSSRTTFASGSFTRFRLTSQLVALRLQRFFQITLAVSTGASRSRTFCGLCTEYTHDIQYDEARFFVCFFHFKFDHSLLLI